MLQQFDCEFVLLCPAFHVGDGDPNPGPHASLRDT